MRAAAFGPQGLGSSAAQHPTHSGTPVRALAAVPALRPWACALFRTCGPPRVAALAEARHAPACARKRAYQQGARSSRTTRIRGGRKRPKHTARTGGSGWHRRICWTGSSGALPATCRYRCACNQKAPAARSCGRCRLSPSSCRAGSSPPLRANKKRTAASIPSCLRADRQTDTPYRRARPLTAIISLPFHGGISFASAGSTTPLPQDAPTALRHHPSARGG